MKIFETENDIKKNCLNEKGLNLVPTMGNLHEGHLSLIEKSKSYIFTPYALEIQCGYEKFGELISELERSERLIIINEFNFNNTPENVRRTGSKNKLPDARITMEIATITINKSKKK